MLFRNHQIFIVEDQPWISMMLEDMAVALDWEVVASVHNREDALRKLDQCTPTVAVLDIELGATTSFDIAARCSSLGIPVIFTTGYSAKQIPAECGDAPILAKPFSEEEFADALRHAVVQHLQHN